MGCQRIRVEQFNVGGAVEQNRFARRRQPHPQLTCGVKFGVGFDDAPDAVELVVAVERQAIAEVRQQRLSARLNRLHLLANQGRFVGFQLRKCKPRLCQRLPHNRDFKFIRHTADFRSFRHPSSS